MEWRARMSEAGLSFETATRRGVVVRWAGVLAVRREWMWVRFWFS